MALEGIVIRLRLIRHVKGKPYVARAAPGGHCMRLFSRASGTLALGPGERALLYLDKSGKHMLSAGSSRFDPGCVKRPSWL